MDVGTGFNFKAKTIADACGMTAAFIKLSLVGVDVYGPTNGGIIVTSYIPTSPTAGYIDREFSDFGSANVARPTIKLRISPRDASWTTCTDDAEANRLVRVRTTDASGAVVAADVVADFYVKFSGNGGAVRTSELSSSFRDLSVSSADDVVNC